MTQVLAIDQSTSATKALVFSVTGELLAKASREHQQIYPRPGWVEHDAEEIWQNTLSVVRDVALEYPDIGRVSISNQRETLVVFDKATGKPLHNAIVWQCRRGDAICSSLKQTEQAVSVRQQTGLMIDTYFSASKIRWLVENDTDIARGLADGSALVGTIDTYLIYRLTNCQVWATDHTNACRTLLYDIGSLGWSESLCQLFHVPMRALAEIRDSNSDFGSTNVGGALQTAVPIRGVMGDSQASLYALGCYQTGETKVTFGTGSSLLMNVGDNIPVPSEGTVATVAWVIDGCPTYCLEGIISYSGATIQWLRDQLQLITTANETETLAQSVADNGGVYLVPAFAGLSAPYWAADARAAIVGMTAHTCRAHVVRAALESIAYQVRDVLEMMQDQTGIPTGHIHADGGACSNGFLMQFTADMIDAEVLVAEVTESSPLGAVMCGAVGAATESAPGWQSKNRSSGYLPQMPADQADACYTGWQKAVRRVL